VRLTAFLQAAFRPRVAAVLLTAVAASLAALAVLRPALPVDAAAFWIGYALLLASLVPHELGHASASARFGARPRDIGATIYLIYPALYSDVSAAWRLPRRQRVVVDLGGLYFQLVVVAAYTAAYLLTGWQPLWMGILMILGSSVFSLNPIFKFDGYWVVADALGVTNLSQQPRRILRRLGKLLRGQPAEPLPWPAGVTATLGVYTALSFAVWGYFLWRVGPRIWSLSSSLLPQAADFVAGVPGVSFSSLLRSTFMAGLMLYVTWRMAQSLLVAPAVSLVHRLLQQRSAGRPAAETPGRAHEPR
jgi:putative peptide zinc metalloprotease protein